MPLLFRLFQVTHLFMMPDFQEIQLVRDFATSWSRFQSMSGISELVGRKAWEHGGTVELDRRTAGGRDQSQHPSSASSSSVWGGQLGIVVKESSSLLLIIVVGIGVSDRR